MYVPQIHLNIPKVQMYRADWKLLDFSRPENTPDDHTEIWLCRWRGLYWEDQVVEAPARLLFSGAAVKSALVKAVAAGVSRYLWCYVQVPEAPTLIHEGPLIRCTALESGATPCAAGPDGFCKPACAENATEAVKSRCQYQRQVEGPFFQYI